jgi:hypothetical protein
MNGPVFLAVGLLYIAPALHIDELKRSSELSVAWQFHA